MRWQGYAGRVNGTAASDARPIGHGLHPAVTHPDLDSPHGYTKDMQIRRAPVSAWAYLYARFDAEYYAAIGLNQSFIDGNLCEFQPDCGTVLYLKYCVTLTVAEVRGDTVAVLGDGNLLRTGNICRCHIVHICA